MTRHKSPESIAGTIDEPPVRPASHGSADAAGLLRQLMEAPVAAPRVASGVVVGELVALADEGRTPLVLWSGQPRTAAQRARTVIDLHGAHVGRAVVLMFEQGDPAQPIIMGVLRGEAGWPQPDRPGQVEVSSDGERMVVSAREQLVLQCGQASITLTRSGKVLINGTYVCSDSSGVSRIKGGSVQIN